MMMNGGVEATVTECCVVGVDRKKRRELTVKYKAGSPYTSALLGIPMVVNGCALVKANRDWEGQVVAVYEGDAE